MNVFDYTSKMAKVFSEDDALLKALRITSKTNAILASKFRRRDMQVDEFESNDLNFIAFYFIDGNPTNNAYMNKGVLRVDIYTKTRADAAKIRERVVTLVHEHFDERVRAEGQKPCGIKDVYKYRVEFLPLVFN